MVILKILVVKIEPILIETMAKKIMFFLSKWLFSQKKVHYMLPTRMQKSPILVIETIHSQ